MLISLSMYSSLNNLIAFFDVFFLKIESLDQGQGLKK